MTLEAVRATEGTLSPEYAWQSVYETQRKGNRDGEIMMQCSLYYYNHSTKLTSTVSAPKATSRNSRRAGGLRETLICRRASKEI